MSRILLVEDDPSLGYILKEYLQMNDFEVELAVNGKEGLNRVGEANFDVCILDVMMPEMDGFTLAEKIHEQFEELPFIFLTAKALKIDKLKGFKIGAEDYIVKPVDEEELIARINVVLRRNKSQPVTVHEIIQVGQFSFDIKSRKLEKDGSIYVLTEKESNLLKLFAEQPGKLLSRDVILKELWGKNDYFNRRSMDVFISKLRKKLAEDTSIKITNVHGRGYILDTK